AGYAHPARHGKPMRDTPRRPFTVEHATLASWAYGLGALAVALAGAAFGLWRSRLPAQLRERGGSLLVPPIVVLKRAHSGIVGDYLLWIALGTAVLGGVWAATLR